ncbi:MAG: putative transporter [Thermodesulfobacteriota bacterium]
MLSWLADIPNTQPIAHGVIILSLVAALGLALGSVRVRGFSLGIAGTLFAGLIFAHFGYNLDPSFRSFIQEFGLILFVYTIGLQVGPGFLDSLRRQGFALNLLAAGNVLLGVAVTVALCLLLGVDLGIGAGIFAGATTNTPALGAAQEALQTLPKITAERAANSALGYAVAYPFGVLGIILAMVLVKSWFHIEVPSELKSFFAYQQAEREPFTRMTVRVTNPNLAGVPLSGIPHLEDSGVAVSRLKGAGETEVKLALKDTLLHPGDLLLAVGRKSDLRRFQMTVGEESPEDLTLASGPLTSRQVLVTRPEVVGKPLGELRECYPFELKATRLTRADLDMSISPTLRLRFGDVLLLVGTEENLDRAAEVLGNSIKEMNLVRLVPMFLGIALGVVVGCYPFTVGNMPAPLRLGLAGGPLLIAIILSRIGCIGPLLWYMPANANLLLRELGIVLFLSCVGLKSGTHFVTTLLQGQGLLWMAMGVVITLAPIIIVSLIARIVMKMNFVSLCGLLAGSQTDPPALAFAHGVCHSEAPSIAYASVYPLTMVLRIAAAQLLVLFFAV